ncbi:hypothetical protein JW962_01355 [Candidatus Dojkabacteria bacterium]|nr:hypothetical protein [Candidatus Dojkabacteria bacterium]
MQQRHGCNSGITANLGGFFIPSWEKMLHMLFGKNANLIRLLTLQSGPGNKRLHARIFFETDGSVYIIAHIDEINVLNILKPKRLITIHTKNGMGNYSLGHILMEKIINNIQKSLRQKQIPIVDIETLYQEILAPSRK